MLQFIRCKLNRASTMNNETLSFANRVGECVQILDRIGGTSSKSSELVFAFCLHNFALIMS